MGRKKRVGVIAGIISALALVLVGTAIFWNLRGNVKWDTRVRISEEQTEYQNYWVCEGVLMKAEEGYYVAQRHGAEAMHIFYIPKDLSSCEINCTKANCKHEDDSCLATFNDHTVGKFQYNNGYLFYTKEDEKGDIILYRCKVDGSKRTQMLKVADHNQIRSVDVNIHKNHVFVMESWLDGSSRVMDYDMTKVGKTGYETEITKNTECFQIKIEDIKDDFLIYSVVSKEKDKTTITGYNYTKDETETIREIDGISGFIRLAGESIVYTSKEGNRLFPISNPSSEKMLNESPSNQLAVDQQYIYIDNTPCFRKGAESEEHVVSMYTLQGEFVGSILMPINEEQPMLVCYFGDTNVMFAADFSEKQLYTYEKKKINAADGKWNALKYKH